VTPKVPQTMPIAIRCKGEAHGAQLHDERACRVQEEIFTIRTKRMFERLRRAGLSPSAVDEGAEFMSCDGQDLCKDGALRWAYDWDPWANPTYGAQVTHPIEAVEEEEDGPVFAMEW